MRPPDRELVGAEVNRGVLAARGVVREGEALVERRNEARRNRDFAMSDKIRQELLDRGVLIEDTREGARWRRK
jgi:cysteinyl-tRNA synthetase